MQLTLSLKQEQCKAIQGNVDKFKVEAIFPDVEYCKKVIQTDRCLWDMRCWNKYKDRKEVMAFLRNIDNNINSINSGHVHLCIRTAYQQGVDASQIAEWIMENPYIMYKNRIVKCWHDSTQCSKFRTQGHYGNGMCESCEPPARAGGKGKRTENGKPKQSVSNR